MVKPVPSGYLSWGYYLVKPVPSGYLWWGYYLLKPVLSGHLSWEYYLVTPVLSAHLRKNCVFWLPLKMFFCLTRKHSWQAYNRAKIWEGLSTYQTKLWGEIHCRSELTTRIKIPVKSWPFLFVCLQGFMLVGITFPYTFGWYIRKVSKSRKNASFFRKC